MSTSKRRKQNKIQILLNNIILFFIKDRISKIHKEVKQII